MKKELNVHIGEVKIAKKGETLKAILGSCVGIGIIWEERKICGLAHCLLAYSPVKTFQIGGRFVDQAIPSLLALMKIKPEDFAELKIVVAGGGNMTTNESANPDQLVGSCNFSAAMNELQKLGLKPSFTEKADHEGRKIRIDGSTFQYSIAAIPRLEESA